MNKEAEDEKSRVLGRGLGWRWEGPRVEVGKWLEPIAPVTVEATLSLGCFLYIGSSSEECCAWGETVNRFYMD